MFFLIGAMITHLFKISFNAKLGRHIFYHLPFGIDRNCCDLDLNMDNANGYFILSISDRKAATNGIIIEDIEYGFIFYYYYWRTYKANELRTIELEHWELSI